MKMMMISIFFLIGLVILICGAYLIIKDIIHTIRSIICASKVQVGDVYVRKYIVNKNNPYERCECLEKIIIKDIKEGWMKYDIDSIGDETTISSLLKDRIGKIFVVVSDRKLYKYKLKKLYEFKHCKKY
jgi:hypothetical protein